MAGVKALKFSTIKEKQLSGFEASSFIKTKWVPFSSGDGIARV